MLVNQIAFHMIIRNLMTITLLSVLLVVFIVMLLSCKQKIGGGKEAGMEYCNCIKNFEREGKDYSVEYCNDSLKKKYTFLAMYLETRNKIPTDIYSKNKIDSMMNFIADYARTLDSCKPPYWLKE